MGLHRGETCDMSKDLKDFKIVEQENKSYTRLMGRLEKLTDIGLSPGQIEDYYLGACRIKNDLDTWTQRLDEKQRDFVESIVVAYEAKHSEDEAEEDLAA